MTNDYTRRRFLATLGQSGIGCAALSSAPALGSLLSLGAASNAAAQSLPPGNDYRALVCILLAGGNDSFNMVVPRDTAEYADYALARSDLALPRASLLPIQPSSIAREYGLHPNLLPFKQLFDAGRLAVLANAGPLVEPTTPAQLAAGNAKLPLGLYSHADQIRQWQTSLPDSRSAVGWGGRVADLFEPLDPTQRLSLGVSLSGTNVFQAGQRAVEYSVTSQGSVGIQGFDDPDSFQVARAAAIEAMANASYANALRDAYGAALRDSIESHRIFSAAIETATANNPLQTSFSNNPVSQGLRMVAQTIAARGELNVRRQTFFLSFGGWDHHDELLTAQAGMFSTLGTALGEFDAALGELLVRDEVTSFTISDFGRTLSSNGRGSDHGWGGNQVVMGGAVRGGDLYGSYPELYPGAPLDTGRGRLAPTLSTDEIFAELALWFGVAASDIPAILPNIDRFTVPDPANPPVGFLL